MGEQLHISHRAAYLRGWENGKNDAQAARDYRPNDEAVGTVNEQRAHQLGYMDGWIGAGEDTGPSDDNMFRDPQIRNSMHLFKPN